MGFGQTRSSGKGLLFPLLPILVLLFFTLFSSGSARAFLLEPYAGYQLSSVQLSGNTVQNDYGKIMGPGLGARLGLQSMTLMGGLDFFYGSGKLDLKDNSSKADYDVTGTELGVFVGVDLPAFLRLWAGYIFMAKLKEDGGGDGYGTWDGHGIKLGAGFKMVPAFSLNLEYKSIKYDSWESQTGSASANSSYSGTNFTSHIWLLSVSMPLELP